MIVRVVRFHRMIRFTCPSTAPELCGRVSPFRTAAWSVTNDAADCGVIIGRDGICGKCGVEFGDRGFEFRTVGVPSNSGIENLFLF